MIGSKKYLSMLLLMVAVSTLTGCAQWPAPFARPNVPDSLTSPGPALMLPKDGSLVGLTEALLSAADDYHSCEDKRAALVDILQGEK